MLGQSTELPIGKTKISYNRLSERVVGWKGRSLGRVGYDNIEKARNSNDCGLFCGEYRSRTGDLLHAMQAL